MREERRSKWQNVKINGENVKTKCGKFMQNAAANDIDMIA